MSAFRHHNFRFFWSGQLISLVGTWMQSVAQSWLVLQLTNSAFQVGLINALQFGPVLLLGMLGGVTADRTDKRRLLVCTQTASAVQALILGLLVVHGRVQVHHLWLLASFMGVINAFDVPTRQSFVVEMVGREDLMNAIALNSSAFNTARIVGPAVGGVLIARLGVGPVFLVNAASYLAVIFSLFMLRRSALHPSARAPRTGVWASLQVGLRYVRATPPVLVAVFLVGAVATFGMNFSVLLSVMARDVFQIGSKGYGMLMSSIGVGSVLAALALAFRSRVDPLRTMLLGGAGVAIFEVLFALSPGTHFLPISVFLLLLVGFSAISLTATANTAIQQQVPDELRGRVMSVYVTVFSGSVPAGSLLAGALARRLGAPTAVGLGAVLSGVSVVWAWLYLRRLRRNQGRAYSDLRV